MSKLEKYIRKDLPDEFYITRLTLKELKEMQETIEKKKWKITTSCTLITEYIDDGFKDVEDVYDNFECGDGKEVDYQDEQIHKIEVSEDGGKTWREK